MKVTKNDRSCIVSRKTLPSEDLLRFVVGPEQKVYVDLKGKLPGRGAWVELNQHSVEIAIKRKLFHRAFCANVGVDMQLGKDIERQLRAQMLSRLSFCAKAGQLTQGYDKVASQIKTNSIKALLLANNAGKDGVAKAEKLIRTTKEHNIQFIRELSSEELSSAIGAANSVHIALSNSQIADQFLISWRQYVRYTNGEQVKVK